MAEFYAIYGLHICCSDTVTAVTVCKKPPGIVLITDLRLDLKEHVYYTVLQIVTVQSLVHDCIFF